MPIEGASSWLLSLEITALASPGSKPEFLIASALMKARLHRSLRFDFQC
jgi:hypothetical protein